VESQVSKCPARKPMESQACEPCDFCDDESLNENCNDNGDCVDGACVCIQGSAGAVCDVEATCGSGVNDVHGTCCVSGVLGSDGECCTKPSTDLDGMCCAAGTVDACGICGGDGIGFDVTGSCCPVRPVHPHPYTELSTRH
jgi:hypothetical protein